MDTPHQPAPASSPMRADVALFQGAMRFAGLSVTAFSVWAFAGGWFRSNGGEPALYAAIAAVFIGLSGPLLHPLLPGRPGIRGFYGAFGPAFLAYAVVWSAVWFALQSKPGEWIATLAGSAVFVGVTALRLGRPVGFRHVTGAFFLFHAAGYFLGGEVMDVLVRTARKAATPEARSQWFVAAKLGWGLCYGLGFGAALGLAYALLRPRDPESPRFSLPSSESSESNPDTHRNTP